MPATGFFLLGRDNLPFGASEANTGLFTPISMNFAAIDFGKHGAIAVGSDEDGLASRPSRIFPMPDLSSREGLAMLAKFIVSDTDFVVAEAVSAMPGQGVTSMFNFGRGVGRVEGVMAAIGIELILIRPVEWTVRYGKRKDHETLLLWKKHLQEEAGKYLGNPVPSGHADAALIWRHVLENGRPKKTIKL